MHLLMCLRNKVWVGVSYKWRGPRAALTNLFKLRQIDPSKLGVPIIVMRWSVGYGWQTDYWPSDQQGLELNYLSLWLDPKQLTTLSTSMQYVSLVMYGWQPVTVGFLIISDQS